MGSKKFWVIRFLALLGLALSIELAVVYYNANVSKTGLYSICSINDYVDCDGVAKHYHSQMAGIPLAWWGIAFYLFVLLMTVVDKINSWIATPLRAFKNTPAYLSALCLMSFCFSMGLAAVSIIEIKKICIFCFMTYFINLIMSLVATDFKAGGYIESFKISFKDFIDGVKQYKIAFSIFMILAVGFLTYSTVSFKFVSHLQFYRSVMKYSKAKTNKYAIKGNTLGVENGEVKLYMITDYVCPMCRINNMIVHDVIREYGNVEVIHRNYPLDKECQKGMASQIHPGACLLSKIAIASKKQGHYWDMASKLYDMKGVNTKEILRAAQDVGINHKQLWYDALSPETAEILQKDIDFCQSKKVNATPSMVINDKLIVGLKNPENLREILEENGAKKR